jgi:putative oxygen-independent coproporphyrinogen III oxidase
VSFAEMPVAGFNCRVPGLPPDGDPVPDDGALPPSAVSALAQQRALSWYFHVPYCRARCGYCDFNTYTASELRDGASAANWAETVIAEIRLARRVLADLDVPAPTVFLGGGTPSLLPPADVAEVLAALRAEFGLAGDAEVTAEANPDDVTDDLLDGWAAAGVNRISLGMQSAVPDTLRILERTHRAEQLPAVVDRIRRSGIAQVSLDLIYGTPGEGPDDWCASLEAALALRPDHVSAYCLGIEEGTRLGARLRAGTIEPVDQDEAADRYRATDAVLSGHGFAWYEISNWALPGAQCQHNLGYWRGASWWGAGPGAHSHIGGVRWWNVRHPSAWTTALREGRSPGHGREVLTGAQQREEALLLGIRLAEGLPTSAVPGGRTAVGSWVADGRAEWLGPQRERFRLTLAGRLLADRLVLDAVTAAPPERIAVSGSPPYTGTL